MEPDQQASATPGRYDVIRIKSRSTVTFSPGTYYIDRLEVLEPQATILLSDDTTSEPFVFFVREGMTFRGAVVTTSTHAAELFVGYFGTSDVYLDAAFDGFIVAPNARLVAATTGNRGSFFAKDVEFYADASMRHRPLRLGDFFPGSNDFDGVDLPPKEWQYANDPGSGSVSDIPGWVPGQEECAPGLELVTATTGDMESEPRLQHRAPSPGQCTVQYQECDEDDLTLSTARIPTESELNAPPDPSDTCPAIPRPEPCGILEETIDFSPQGLCEIDAHCVGRGFICALVCADASCETTERRCAFPDPSCRDVHEEDNCATANECPEPNHTGEPNPRNDPESILDSVNTPPAEAMPTPAPPPPPQYPVGSAGDDREDSPVCTTGVSGNGTPVSAPPESRRIVAGNDKWGIYAEPLVEFSSDLQPLSIEGEANFQALAHGQFAAGVKVWGKDVRVLNAEARAELTTCGFDLSGQFEIFGVLVDGSTNPSDSRACNAVFASRGALLQPMRKAMVDAVKVWKYVEQAGATQRLCNETRSNFHAAHPFPFTLPCDSQANFNAAAQHWVDYFRHLRDQVLGHQATLDALQAEISGALPGSIDLLNFSRRFTAFQITMTYPIGPVTVTIEIELSGGWGVHGVLEPALEFSPTRVGGSIELRPTLETLAYAFAGVGVGPVSFGVSGELLLIRIETPLRSELFLQQEEIPEDRQPKVLQESLYDLPSDVPHAFPSGAKKYRWVAGWTYGARADLSSLDGRVDLEGRINMLFFKKRFRKKLADWRGTKWTPFDFVGGELALGRVPEIGTFGETIFFLDPDWLLDQLDFPTTPPNPSAPYPSLGPCVDDPK